MDLIYTDASRHDVGVLAGYSFDLAFGADENDFECKIASSDHCCEDGSYLYIEGTEYGGVVDTIAVDTAAEIVTYRGRTWHGILESKVVVPLLSSDTSTSAVTIKTAEGGTSLVNAYLIISGDANACIAWLINRIGLDSLFAVDGLAGVNINQYKFDRYTDAYLGIRKMLKSVGYKLAMSFDAVSRKTILNAVPIVNYSAEDISADLFDFSASKKYKSVNHLICLGAGELADRTVVHLYADEDGNISTTQTQFSADEYVATYENTSDGADELTADGAERLAELWQQDEISISVFADTFEYGIGDIVSASDPITELTITAKISKKIVNIENDVTTIQYEVGD